MDGDKRREIESRGIWYWTNLYFLVRFDITLSSFSYWIQFSMDLRDQIGRKVKWLMDNQRSLMFWVPLIAFSAGAGTAWYYWRRRNKRKMVDETCLICYNNLRDTLLSPCNHLIVCRECTTSLRTCPVCRQDIQNAVPLGDFLAA